MRKADTDHGWQKCRADKSALWIDAISARHGAEIHRIDLTSRVIAVVGPNGAGKTRFLSELHEHLAQPAATSLQISQVHGSFRGRPIDNSPLQRPPTAYFDASRESHRSRGYFKNQAELRELLDQFEARNVVGNELDKYKHVCGKNYVSFRVREVEAPAEASIADEDPEDVIPFFEVECNGVAYDSLSMGFGELCACSAIWWICRAEKSSALLLDEPDSHLSPASRSALLDVVALEASENKHFVVLATHSSECLRNLSEKEILVIHDTGAGGGKSIYQSENKRQIVRSLGLSQPVKVLLAVEDVDSLEVVRQSLNWWGDGLERSFEVQIVTGGANELNRFVGLFPKDARSLKIRGVLDGDKRNEFATSEFLLYLPGDTDPIANARSKVPIYADGFASALGVPVERLISAHDRVAHVDHHDYLHSLVSSLGINGTVSDARSALVRLWIQHEEIAPELRTMCVTLKTVLFGLPLD